MSGVLKDNTEVKSYYEIPLTHKNTLEMIEALSNSVKVLNTISPKKSSAYTLVDDFMGMPALTLNEHELYCKLTFYFGRQNFVSSKEAQTHLTILVRGLKWLSVYFANIPTGISVVYMYLSKIGADHYVDQDVFKEKYRNKDVRIEKYRNSIFLRNQPTNDVVVNRVSPCTRRMKETNTIPKKDVSVIRSKYPAHYFTKSYYDSKIQQLRETYRRPHTPVEFGYEPSLNRFLDKLQIEAMSDSDWPMDQTEIRLAIY